MKKIYSLLIFIFFSAILFAQGTETFTNTPIATTPASYVDRTWMGDNAQTWTAINGRTDSPTDAGLTGFTAKYIVIRNATGKVSCIGIVNGCADVTFTYARAYAGNGTIALFVNGTQYGTTLTVSNTAATTVTIPVNISGTFTLELRTSNTNRVALDNIIWTANSSTPCVEPASQPTALTFGTITASSIGASYTTTTADKYIVIRSTSNTLTATPADGTTYTINSTLGGGTVIANGTSTSFTDIGLSQTTTYFYYVFAYNDVACSGGANYNVTSYPTPNNATTLAIPACTTPAAPNNPITLTPTNTSISGSFIGTGASKYLIIRSAALPPLGAAPTDGTIYTAGQAIGNGTVETFTTATTFVASTLTPATTYYFYVFAANDGCTGTAPVYSTSFADGSSTTTNITGIPTGYYDAAIGLTCALLKTAVSTIITTGHTQNNYGGLDNIEMLTTDDRLNDAGTATIVWDMYSDNPNGADPYTFTFAQFNIGSGSDGEGNGWNKEHSFPNSWFSASSSTSNFPGADLYHLYPTDMDVNSLRSNYPYGKVATATTTTSNGSKLGSSALVFPGYTGPVFEPIDAYKGDLARATLYMVTRYQAEQPTWESLQAGGDVVMDGTTYPSVEIDYLKMLIQWHNQDPVSTKEIDRNNTVYGFQGNRNPFVDHPEYVGQIWSTACGLALPIDLLKFEAKNNGTNVYLKWITENAIGFNRFEIERSEDGSNFKTIGSFRGSLGNNSYNFEDNFLPKTKIAFYRLKMVDNDGKHKYSLIINVNLNNSITNAFIFPNPVTDKINIRLKEALIKNSNIQITDVQGRVVLNEIAKANEYYFSINAQRLTTGRYFVKIVNDKQVINETFIILK